MLNLGFAARCSTLRLAGPAPELYSRASRAFCSCPILTSKAAARIAVLYQAIEPPVINGVTKPMKPGGYRDSAADIAYCLSTSPSVTAITRVSNPEPTNDSAWCFPDHEEGILSALDKGATHLWANTILFASHPIQTSDAIGKYADKVKLIGQPPLSVEQFDDKEVVNNMLRAAGTFTMPMGWTISDRPDLAGHLRSLDMPFPVVGKPIRGRGSHGVKVCRSLDELVEHAKALFKESPKIMVEQFLQGEEATVTVMPPAEGTKGYWALPVVRRFNHQEGIAPYNGVVAVTSNSEAVTSSEDPAYEQVMRECERAAQLLGTTAPIRIDVRRPSDGPGSKFCLFDVNMKPNMTGPGRPGREDQASLTLLAAEALGWDYSRLLEETLKTASTLAEIREKRPTR